MKALKWLDQYFEEVMLCIFLVLISCVSFLQIIMRTVAVALPWPEEFDRFCWIWTVFLSLAYTIKNESYLRVSVLIEQFPEKVHKVFNLVADIACFAVCLVFFVNSFAILGQALGSGETSPAIQIPMYVIYFVEPLGFGLGIVRSVQVFIKHIRTFNERELTSIELTMQQAEEEAAAARRAEGGAN